jgi:lysozyme
LGIPLKTSKSGINLIKEFEGCELTAYLCPAKVWTIGYGTTSGVKEGQKITEIQAEDFLKKDLVRFESAVNRMVRVPITQGIFDALVSFTYNLGAGALATSTLLRLLNDRKYSEAGDQLLRWNKVEDEELEGLTRRRRAERKVFYSQPFPGSKK